ncbi:hypothetical protein [Pseudorhodoplanes sp.]|uniref:hypothetical protein n=1 Tax=Pseudorhodoplanes sp. TaxID=1934341 RepID=UPI00391970EE
MDTQPATVRATAGLPSVEWGPVWAGAIAAAALAFVLHSFAAAMGLAVGSTAPTWRDASMTLFVLSGIYLVLVALAAYGIGGYIAGSMLGRTDSFDADESETRDGTHGLLVWALATLMAALLLIGGAIGASRLAAPASGNAGPAVSVPGETIIAFDLDRLFRSDGRPIEGDVAATRAEAARILLTAGGHSGVQAEDRAYLTRLVAAHTGLSAGDAQKRVETVIASARETISRARNAAVLLAFLAGAASLLGAVAAWYGACAGARHRATQWGTSIWRTLPRRA